MPSRNDIGAGLLRMDKAVRTALLEGARAATPDFQDALQGTDAHDDQTGATRASYVVYASSPDDDGSGAFDAAHSAASGLDPEHAVQESLGSPEGVTVIATAATQQSRYLEESSEHATIGPLFDQYAGQIAQGAFAAVKRVLG